MPTSQWHKFCIRSLFGVLDTPLERYRRGVHIPYSLAYASSYILGTTEPKNFISHFMRGINFYRKFISHFSQLACPLHQLSHQPKFVWTPEDEHHFMKLNTTLCSAPILQLPDMNHPFEIETNASQFAIGAVIKHGGHPITYHCETLTNAKVNYNTYDKEFYSLVHTLKK